MTTTTTTATATATAKRKNDAHKDWYLENIEGVIELIARETEVDEDTVESIMYDLKEAGKWPSLASEDAGYAQAYEALVRAAVLKYSTPQIMIDRSNNNKGYIAQADAVRRYKARRMRTDAAGRAFVDFSKGGATKRLRSSL
jgi:hypothetical protein